MFMDVIMRKLFYNKFYINFYRAYVAIKPTNAATVEEYVYMMKMQTHTENSVIIRIEINH